VIGAITTARRRAPGEPKSPAHANIAFTAPGLQQLGLDDDAVQTFSREFVLGMAERAGVLGDAGDSAPARWTVGGPGTDPVHVLLLLYATSAAALDELTGRLWTGPAPTAGLAAVFRQDSVRENSNEPFGFRDGISQPAIEGVGQPPLPGQSVVKAGEFLLGYENEYGERPPMPTVAHAADPRGLLPVSETEPPRKDLGRNGTYLVWRKLAQDVAGFWRFMDSRTRGPDGASDPERRSWLAAKLVGRWPSGAPLVLAPVRDDPALGSDGRRNNDFTFMPTDPNGFACPLGSHIRRANPRDSLQPTPAESVRLSNRHRIMRRGRPYQQRTETGTAQGLVFIALNADLSRQFEFIQQTWIINPKFNGLYADKDPIIGDNDGSGVMTIQARPVRERITGLPRFVTARGGGYFFLPGMNMLRYLAAPR